MAEISHSSKPRSRLQHQDKITAKSNIFQRRDLQFDFQTENKQPKNQPIHPLWGSSYSSSSGGRLQLPKQDQDPQNNKFKNKQMFSSSLLGLQQKTSIGSLFQMARHVSDPIDEEQLIKAEKEKNKYSFLQVSRSNTLNISENLPSDLKTMGTSMMYQRKQFKAPSFLKKDNRSSVDLNEDQPQTPLKIPEQKNIVTTRKLQNEAKSQAQSKKSNPAELNTSQNFSPVLMRTKFSVGSQKNSSDSKNLSTNEPKQSTINNTLLDPKLINQKNSKNLRKSSMFIQNEKEFYTPTQKHSGKLQFLNFVEITEKYKTAKNQNKSQFLQLHEVEKTQQVSPKVNEKQKKVLIPSFIKFKEKRNELLKKSSIEMIRPSSKAPQEPIPPNPNKITLDDFEIKDRLGKGAFGDVYLARQKNIGFICVLKKLSKKRIKQQNTQELILRQIKIQSFLTHRHITNLYGFFDDKEYIYLVMQYMSDGSLAQRFNRKKVSEKQVACIVKQICEALRFMHIQSIIHRDIKPDNVFIHEDYIKLGDFGCSVFSDSKRNTMVGSLAYFSPQQLNNQSYDEKIDVWSVGILCYELLTGRSPFQEDIIKIARQQKQARLSQLRFPSKVELSEEAKDFTRKLLQQIPQNRMSIMQTLKHPFIVKNSQTENAFNQTEVSLKQN